jgi:hypothetical protein
MIIIFNMQKQFVINNYSELIGTNNTVISFCKGKVNFCTYILYNVCQPPTSLVNKLSALKMSQDEVLKG